MRAHVALFEGFYGPMEKKYPGAVPERLIDESLKRMLNAFTGDLITRTGEAVAEAGIADLAQVRGATRRLVALSSEMEALRREAKQYLSRHLYESDAVAPDHQRAVTLSVRFTSVGCAIRRCCLPTAPLRSLWRGSLEQSPTTSPE